MSEEVVFNVRKITKALDELEPGLKKQMVRDIKKIARPMANDISSEIKTINPLSGFSSTPSARSGGGYNSNPSGRMSWENGLYKNSRISPENTLIRYRQNRSRRAKITSLVSIWVRNPMAAVVGVAGKGSGTPRRAVTNEYNYKGGKRRHRLNGQGAALIGQVRSRGWFNYFYKSAESKMPDTEREVKLVWEKYSSKVSRRI
jgi:hypothetical protein